MGIRIPTVRQQLSKGAVSAVIDLFGIQIVQTQPLGGHVGVGRSRAAVVAVGVDADTAARHEFAPHFDVLGVHQPNEVFHDDVDTVFVKITVIAETEQIQFERLALHHLLVGQVADVNRGEVGLAGNRAQRGELRTVELHEIIVFGMFVVERFEYRRIVVGRIPGVFVT